MLSSPMSPSFCSSIMVSMFLLPMTEYLFMIAPLSGKSSLDMSTMSSEPLFLSSSSFEFEPVLFLVEEITVDSDFVSCGLS